MEVKVKAFYTIPELAKMAGVPRNRMERLLKASGVRMRKVSSKGPGEKGGQAHRVYMLSDLKEALPELWDSLLLVASMRGEEEA